MNQYFAFSSGGAYDFQGFGEWKLRADDSGHLTVDHDLFGAVTSFGTFQLLPDESASLWDLIAGAAFDRRDSSRGPGVPDETMLGFALSAQETLNSVQLWASDAFADLTITKLIHEIERLIEKYTGRKPTLR
jgi:hypothetical protein